MSAPVVILVRPQLGENIGAVARAMSNFGMSDLRLVSPKNGWPNPRANDMAVGGEHIIEATKVFDSLAEAMHDIELAYGTTHRSRMLEKRVIEAREAAQEISAEGAKGRKVAILFGPERTGLENDDIVPCDALVTILTDTKNPSLNISQAAVILAYECCRWRSDLPPVGRGHHADGALASKQEVDGFLKHLEGYLDEVNHFRTPDKKGVMWQNLQNIFVRAQMNEQEVRSMRGVIRALFLRRKED